MKPHSFSLLVALFASRVDVIIGMGWETISHDNFDNGWGNFKDGGSDAMIFKNKKNVGPYDEWPAVRLRDDSSSSTITHKKEYNVANYNNLRVTFKFCAVNMEKKEGFLLQLHDGSSWDNLKNYRLGRDFENGNLGKKCFESKTLTFRPPKSNSAKIRFKCNGSANDDSVYIDDVLFEGYSTGRPVTTTTTPGGPSPGPGDCHHIRLHWQYGYNWQQKGMDVAQDWCLTWVENSDKSTALLKQCSYEKSSKFFKRQQWKIDNGKIKMCYYDKCLTRTDLIRGKWVVVDDCSLASDRQTFSMNKYEIEGSKSDFDNKHNKRGNGIKCNGPECYYEGTFRGDYHKFPVYTWMAKGWMDGPKGLMRCLSNFLHHPKPNEALHLAQCKNVKNYRTLFWNFEVRGFGHEVQYRA